MIDLILGGMGIALVCFLCGLAWMVLSSVIISVYEWIMEFFFQRRF